MLVDPKYIFALVVVIALAIYIKISNPYREYGTSEYWQNATIESIKEIPGEAFAPGNKNGPLLLWAAGDVSDPKIITALVERGGDINEVDGIFMGTPLTAAAADSNYPEIIREIIRLGGNIEVRAMSNNTALMTAALYNQNEEIIKVLVELGAKLEDKNVNEDTALDLAIKKGNIQAEKVLLALGAKKNHID